MQSQNPQTMNWLDALHRLTLFGYAHSSPGLCKQCCQIYTFPGAGASSRGSLAAPAAPAAAAAAALPLAALATTRARWVCTSDGWKWNHKRPYSNIIYMDLIKHKLRGGIQDHNAGTHAAQH